MATVDWIILIVIAVAVLGGLSQGFFRSAFSLGGLIAGLVLASWNYKHPADLLMPLVHIRQVADAIGFLVIALLVMVLAGVIGSLLAKAFKWLGLGWLDRLAGGAFGFLQGALLVTIGILVIVAFFPQRHLLDEGRFPRLFFGACHLSTQMSPEELARRIREGLRTIESESPEWMHTQSG